MLENILENLCINPLTADPSIFGYELSAQQQRRIMENTQHPDSRVKPTVIHLSVQLENGQSRRQRVFTTENAAKRAQVPNTHIFLQTLHTR
ncbi:hypothetical protein AVEN_75028-1 [Araneus ventricosus]|uniref:Uncharacterized protein n=1 Tax=Araneus ventricosus TaxID=182803 RepID=A0A4Y2GS97_ARAVE|nr:hypothetical protein AVEN_75028-1 [Araneus ventricosus]